MLPFLASSILLLGRHVRHSNLLGRDQSDRRGNTQQSNKHIETKNVVVCGQERLRERQGGRTALFYLVQAVAAAEGTDPDLPPQRKHLPGTYAQQLTNALVASLNALVASLNALNALVAILVLSGFACGIPLASPHHAPLLAGTRARLSQGNRRSQQN